MQIALLLYEGLTALDIVGPYEILCRIPEADLRFVAKETGPVRVDTRAFALVADHALADITAPDVFVVPGGGSGTFAASRDGAILDWVRAAHRSSRWTSSVCTGSLILGAAEVLNGRRATTHWAAADLLQQFGAEFTPERVVRDGKIVTAAGVSSGIDMALMLARELAGVELAQAIQLQTEYDPEPPFESGSPEKAGDDVVALARRELARQL